MPSSTHSRPPILPTTNNAPHPKRQNTATTTRTTSTRTPSASISRKPVPPKRTQSSLKRPALCRAPTTQTQYVDLLVRLDEIPRWHNILCAFCTWILLAGYLVFPATFTKVQARVDGEIDDGRDRDAVTVFVASAVKNVGLLWVAGICCVVGAAGLVWLWIRWWWHYIWLLNRVFLPGATNSVAGLISTLINIYSAQDGRLSITAKVTVGVTAGCSVVFGGLFVIHQLLLMRVKKKHERQIEAEEKRERQLNGEYESSALQYWKKKAQEPASMPGGVV
ncbi:hypothetical protein B0J12DRAFT_359661 [Macrophomina phaseolina]|uniref:Uncharacterized protein n=1 Tax=Macrophomina phaseolina TaxID=35725 RepID=A0ABQ8FTZ8_9PEZI|nr:hypothetical protein B0J12DRAFT_359661 [Macrophomina phaseolina]